MFAKHIGSDKRARWKQKLQTIRESMGEHWTYHVFHFLFAGERARVRKHTSRSHSGVVTHMYHLEAYWVWNCSAGVQCSTYIVVAVVGSVGLVAERAPEPGDELNTLFYVFQANDIDCAHDPISLATIRETAFVWVKPALDIRRTASSRSERV